MDRYAAFDTGQQVTHRRRRGLPHTTPSGNLVHSIRLKALKADHRDVRPHLRSPRRPRHGEGLRRRAHRAQRARMGRDRAFPVDVLREAAALGMATIYVREENGGSGMTRLDAALIFEALSTGCPCVASFLSIHNMVAWVVDRFGSAELQERYLPRLASMELIASYCLTEPGAGSDAAALTAARRRDGDHLRARRRQAVHLRRRRERRLSRHGAHRRGRRERGLRLHRRQGGRRA